MDDFVFQPSSGALVFRADAPHVVVGGTTAVYVEHTTFVPAVRPDTPHDQQTTGVPALPAGPMFAPYPHHLSAWSALGLETVVAGCAAGTAAIALSEYLRRLVLPRPLPP